MHNYNISKLQQIYKDGEEVDRELFAEERSNVLLVTGNHYSNKTIKALSTLRDTRGLAQEQRLRLTKNHTQVITKKLRNNILQYAPGVLAVPKKKKDNQDQKQAQLNNSVLHDLKQRQRMRSRIAEYCQDYVDVGECAVKLFWDPCAGKFKGWESEIEKDEHGNLLVDESGNYIPKLDETGQMVASDRPVFQGDFVFEKIFPANLLRSKETKDMRGSPGSCLMYRKMTDVKELKARVEKSFDDENEREEKLRYVVESQNKEFVVFDGTSKGYQKTEGQCLLIEYYFWPCYEFPNGYFFITTETGILWEGEIPFGVFPIFYCGWDQAQTTPRSHGILKQLRPNQVEINRTASKIAETQTAFDDKLLIQSGTKITNGGTLPGVRGISYTGQAPIVMEGRSGDQYLAYLNSQIDEMYVLANIKDDAEEKAAPPSDFGSLFKSIRNQKKFAIHAEKFEEFLINLFTGFLRLAKEYYPDDMLIPAIGTSEYINIPEFRSTTDLFYQIELEPQNDDVDTMMGKQLAINHVLQYAGNQLGKDEIGKMLRSMPLGNFDESFSDLTLDYDLAQNMCLALDRGEIPQPNFYDNHKYMIKKLTWRMRQPDFNLLSPEIQKNYDDMVKWYEEMEATQQRELIAAQSKFIPSGGARIKVDYYVDDPKNPGRAVRATLPAESVDWLIKRLADQGSSQEQLALMKNTGAVQQIAQIFNQQQVPAGMGMEFPQSGGPNSMGQL